MVTMTPPDRLPDPSRSRPVGARAGVDRKRVLGRVSAVATGIALVGGIGAAGIAVALAASRSDGASASPTSSDSGSQGSNPVYQDGNQGNGGGIGRGNQNSAPQGGSHGS